MDRFLEAGYLLQRGDPPLALTLPERTDSPTASILSESESNRIKALLLDIAHIERRLKTNSGIEQSIQFHLIDRRASQITQHIAVANTAQSLHFTHKEREINPELSKVLSAILYTSEVPLNQTLDEIPKLLHLPQKSPIETMLISDLTKSNHLRAGTFIIPPDTIFLDQTVQVLMDLIRSTDLIDTLTDSGAIPEKESSSIRAILLNYYQQIFNTKASSLHPLPLETSPTIQRVMTFIFNHIDITKARFNKLCEVKKFEPSYLISFVELIHEEVGMYIKGVTDMDTKDIVDPYIYLSDVCSRVSNMALLGTISIALTNRNYSIEDFRNIIRGLQLFHSSHIAEDGLSDIEIDRGKLKNGISGTPNLWLLIKDEETNNHVIDEIVQTHVQGFEILRKVLDTDSVKHWIFVSMMRLNFYLEQTLLRNRPENYRFAVQYFQKQYKCLEDVYDSL